MKAILHIGDQKTGTKSIQMLLRHNSPLWRKAGVVSPSSTKGAHYDIGLGALFKKHGGPWRKTFAHHHGIGPDDIEAHVRTGLERELHGMHTAIFSFEGLLWLQEEEIAALKHFLQEYFDTIEIAVFLRRQDRKAASLYSTKLLLGRGELALLPATGDFDFGAALDNWLVHFDQSTIKIFIFEDQPDTAGAFVRTFVPYLPIENIGRQNESLSGQAQAVLEFMRGELEHRLPVSGQAMQIRQVIARELVEGSVARPTEEAARAFVERFRAGNRHICRAFEMDREDLFDVDFSEYRTEQRPTAFTAADVARVALSMWEAGSSTRSR